MTLKFKILKISNLNIIEQHFKLRVGKGTEKITLIDLTFSLSINKGRLFSNFQGWIPNNFPVGGDVPSVFYRGDFPPIPPITLNCFWLNIFGRKYISNISCWGQNLCNVLWPECTLPAYFSGKNLFQAEKKLLKELLI